MTADVPLPTCIHILSLHTHASIVLCVGVDSNILQALSQRNASLAAFAPAFIFAHCSPHFPQFNGFFSTLSHKGAVCLQRATARNHCCALRLKLTTEMTGSYVVLFKRYLQLF